MKPHSPNLPQRLLLLLVSVLLAPMIALGQSTTKGKILGSVIDSETGEPLIGANVVIEGTTIGAATDLDGRFIIPSVDSGSYSVIVSVISFARQRITNLRVAPGESAVLNVVLTPEVIQTDEVVIEARAVSSYEGGLLTRQKKAVAISDGISAEQIKRAPDATAGDALKRVSGISLVDNKFVFVRGVSDRYNQTTLNGATVASTSADRKSFSFDLLPSGLIDNTTVLKSATPDLPGDFSGGLVQLTTLDFPENQVLKLSLSAAYNDMTSLRGINVTQRGTLDWLGMDDGTRKLPEDSPDLLSLARNLPNTWAPRSGYAPLNTSLSLAYGNQVELGGLDIGWIGSVSYRNGYQSTQTRITDTRFGAVIRDLSGVIDQYNVLWGAVADVNLKIGRSHKISLKNNYNRAAEDKIIQTQGFEENDGEQRNFTLEWDQRSIYSGQVAGEHALGILGGTKVNWSAGVSSSRTEQPDRRAIQFARVLGAQAEDPFISEPGERSWSLLNERATSFKTDMTVPLLSGKMKLGALVEEKDRNYGIRYFQVNYLNLSPPNYYLFIEPLETVYEPVHFGPGKFSLLEVSKPSDTYAAGQVLYAGYLMADLPFSVLGQNLRFAGGVRLENSEQLIHTTASYSSVEPYTTRVKNVDVLPSVNLTYAVTENANLRFAYSHTVNRPEFRELANVLFYDFNTYESVFGNSGLRRAFVRNVDARFELFPDAGELLAVSYFYKSIRDAIEERLLVSGANPSRTWFNSERGSNLGWEFEIRKSLGFVSDYLQRFSVAANYTRIYSAIEYVEERGTAGSVISTRAVRPMQGQSPYMINVSLVFTEPDLGTTLSVLYHRIGPRINAVGYLDDDIYEASRDLIDFSVTQPVFGWLETKMTVKDLLGKEQVLTRRGEVYRSNRRGTTVSLQLGVSL